MARTRTRTFKTDLALALDFLRSLVEAWRGIPSAMAEDWRAGHTRTAWLREWEKGNLSEPGEPVEWFSFDTKSEASYRDYRLWYALGIVSDALIVLVVLLVILAVAL